MAIVQGSGGFAQKPKKKKKEEAGFQKLDVSAYQPAVPLERPPMQSPGVGRPDTYKAPAVDEQIKNLSTAYYKLHDSFPTPFQTLVLLRTAPGLPRSVADWTEFLGPGVKDGELPQPGDVETEVAQVDDFDVVSGPVTAEVGGNGIIAATEQDRQLFWEDPSSTDPTLAKQRFDQLLALQRESRDKDPTLWERQQHDILLSDVRSFKEEMAERSRAMGEQVDFDVESDDIDAATINAYRRWAMAPQFAALTYGDGDEQENAAGVLASLGVSPDQIDAWLNIREAIEGGDYTSADVLDTAYDNYIYGRSMGQTEQASRWDFVAKYGMDKIPEKMHETVIGEQKTLDDLMMAVTKPIMWAFEGLDWLNERISPIDALTESLRDNPQLGGRVVSAVASYAHDLNEEFVNGELFGKAVGYEERGLVTAHTMFAQALGYHIEDGELVGNGEGISGLPGDKDADFGVLFRASEWMKAWRYGEGKMIVNEMAHRIAPMYGVEPDNALLRMDVAMADYTVAIWLGAKLDRGMWKAAKPMWTGAYQGTRAVDRELRWLAGNYSDARLKVYGSPGAQRGSFTVRGIGGVSDPDMAKAMRMLADERDVVVGRGVAAAEAGVVRGSSMPEVYARIKELGIKRAGNDYWDDSMSIENMAAFRGTIRKGGMAMDKVAQTIADEFSYAGITDSASLWKFLEDYKVPKKVSGKTAPRTDPEKLEELRAKLSEDLPDDELEALVGSIDDTLVPGITDFAPGNFFAETPLAGIELRQKALSLVRQAIRDQRYADPEYAVEAAMRLDRVMADIREGKALSPDDAKFVEEVTGEKYAGKVSELSHEEGVAGQQAMTVPGEKLKETQMGMGLEGGTKAPKPEPIPEQMPGQTGIETPKPTLAAAMRSLAPAEERLTAWDKVRHGEPATIRVRHIEDAGRPTKLTLSARKKLGRDSLLGEGFYGAPEVDDVTWIESMSGKRAGLYDVTLRKPYVIGRTRDDVLSRRSYYQDEFSTKVLGVEEALGKLDVAAIRAQGYDGIIVRYGKYAGNYVNEVVALNPDDAVRVAQVSDRAARRAALAAERSRAARRTPPPKKPAPPKGGEPPREGLPPEVPFYKNVSPLLQNNLEWLTFRTTPEDVALIRIACGIDEADEFKPIVKAIAAERDDPQKVLELIYRMQNEHGLQASFDPTGWGVLKVARSEAWATGFTGRAPIFRVLATPIAYHRIMPDREADLHIYQVGVGVKMGKKKMTADDATRLRKYANDAYLAKSTKARNDVLNRFWDEVKANMEAEGTWGKYEKFRDQVYSWRAKSAADILRRRDYGAGKGARVVPAGYTRDLYAQIKDYSARMLETAPEAERAALKVRLDRATARLDDYREAADILNAKPGAFSAAKLEWARTYMDDLGYPEPIWGFQLQKNLRHREDPRMMAWFQGGKTARTVQRFDALIHERVMRMWKMMVMSSVQFPFRVFLGDEGLRLISEGVIPGRMGGVAKTQRELFGRRLSRGERTELANLKSIDADDIGEVQAARLKELEAKQRGKLSESEQAALNEDSHFDWAEQISDDWDLLTPDDANYFRTLRGFLSELSDEPLVKLFVNQSRNDMPRGRVDIIKWIEGQLVAQDKNGSALRTLLYESGRITENQKDIAKLQRLLASGKLTGAPGNLRAIIDTWADMLEGIRSDERLIGAVKAGGTASTKELAMIPKEHLFPVPGKLAMGTGRDSWVWKGFGGDWHNPTSWGQGAATLATYAWLPKFYERVTMQILQRFSNGLRSMFFSDAYGKELRLIMRDAADLDPKLAHSIAFDRALSYTNKVTFVRNATIAEDLLRNYVLFVNSYRQFWVYWLRMLGRHPFAMTTAYNYHPLKGKLMQELGPFEFVLPAMPFFIPQTEDDEGLKGLIVNQTPGASPFLSWAFGRTAKWAGVKGDLSNLPFLSGTSQSLAPMSSVTNLIYGATGRDVFGNLGADTDVYDRRHHDLMRSWMGQYTGEEVTPETFEDVDYPAYLEPIDYLLKLMGQENTRPELVLQWASKQFIGIGLKERPEVVRQIRDGDYDTEGMTDEQYRAYRKAHPYYDIYQKYMESSDPSTRETLVIKHPWLSLFTVSDYVWLDADSSLVLTTEDFIRNRDEGRVRRVSDRELLRRFETRAIAYWGGAKDDDGPRITAGGELVRGYPGNMERKEAEVEAERQVARSEKWAQKQAKMLANGNAKFEADLMSDWRKADSELPGMFHQVAAREAKAAGIPVEAYERGLIPDLIMEDFYSVYGTRERMEASQPSASQAKVINDLAKSGLVTDKTRRFLLEDSPHKQLIANYAHEEEVADRKALIDDVITEEFYDLDAAKLSRLGIKCGPALDAAVHKVRDYYYNTYQKTVEKYGAQSEEGRKARNAFHAFKDKVFGGVKGGEALAGGLPERVLHLPYLTEIQSTGAQGPETPEQQRSWAEYVAEAKKGAKADPKKLKEYHEKFTPYQEERFSEMRRVAHHIYVAGVALWMRAKMKQSYSEYYKGPGNSVYSNAGKKMVARLDRMMRDIIREDKEMLGASSLAKDIREYFGGTKSYAGALLEWYYR